MKVLIFIGGFLPAKNYGGPVTSIANLVKNLQQKCLTYIVAGNHDLHDTTPLEGIQDGWNDISGARVCYLSDKDFTVKHFVKIIKEVLPDVIFISSFFSYKKNIPAILAAKKIKVPVILSPRGEFHPEAMKIGIIKKKIYINLIKITGILRSICFHATNEDEKEYILNVLGKDCRVYVIPNAPCPIYKSLKGTKQVGTARFVYISRIHKIKNLMFALEILKSVKGKARFDIYGPIEQEEYWSKCLSVIDTFPANVSVKYCGTINPGHAQEVFAKYDCFIFPTLSENYGNAIAEAVNSGCHVIVSRGTTPWDDIDGYGGRTVLLSDNEGWQNAINEIVLMNNDEMKRYDEQLRKYIEKKFDTRKVSDKYIEMFANAAGRSIDELNNI